MRVILIVLWLIIGCGCAGDDFTPYSVLDDLRIMALALNKPQITDSGSAQTVTVTPYISDINGGGRTLEIKVSSCKKPLIDQGELPTCDNRTDRVLVSESSFTPATGGTTMTSPHYTGALSSVAVSVPGNLTDSANSQGQFNGVDYMIEVSVTGGNATVTAIANVSVTQQTTLNTNPSIDRVFQNDTELSSSLVYPTETVQWRLEATNGSAEAYQFIASDGRTLSFTESLQVSFLASRGRFDPGRLGDSKTAEFTPKPDSTTVAVNVAVLRDGRGGLDIMIFR